MPNLGQVTDMFPYPLEDMEGSNLAIDRTLTTWMLRFRTLARFRGNLTNIQSKLAIEIARFPSPLEDMEGSNGRRFAIVESSSMFPSPREDWGLTQRLCVPTVVRRLRFRSLARIMGGSN